MSTPTRPTGKKEQKSTLEISGPFYTIVDKIGKAKNIEDFAIIDYVINKKKFMEVHHSIIKEKEKMISIKKQALEMAKKEEDPNLQIILQKEIRDLKIAINKKENQIEELDKISKSFIKPIENATSPQEVDLYINHLEEEEALFYGDPDGYDNPVALGKILRFLRDKERELLEKREQTRSRLGSVAPAVVAVGGARVSPLRALSVWVPDSLEAWAHPEVTLVQIQNAIKVCRERIKISTDKAIARISKEEQFLYKQKVKALRSLVRYAETSKRNFNRRLFATHILQLNATLFSVLAAMAGGLTAIANAFSFIPIFKVVSDGLKKAFETINYSFLTAAYTLDPTAPKAEKLAAFRHFDALKKYNIAESSLAAVGTLGLATGLLLPVIPAAAATVVAAPLLAPALLVAGTAILTVSNIVSTVNSYFQLKQLQKNFDAHPLKAQLETFKNKEKNSLTLDEKKFLRLNSELKACRSQFWSKLANTATTFFMTLAAAALFTAALAFPPVAIALTVATVIFSVVSIVKMHHEKTSAKETYKINKDIENDTLSKALSTFKRSITPKNDLSKKFTSTIDLEKKQHLEMDESLIKDKKTEKLKKLDKIKDRYKKVVAPSYEVQHDALAHKALPKKEMPAENPKPENAEVSKHPNNEPTKH